MSARETILARALADLDTSLVIIDDESIARFSIAKEEVSPMTIYLDGGNGSSSLSALTFLVAMTGINYRFWSLGTDGSLIRYRHLGKTGAKALWSAFTPAWGGSPSILAVRLKTSGFTLFFGSMPDRGSREEILREMLMKDALVPVCTRLVNEIGASGVVSVQHAQELASAFPKGFADPYLKKAQLTLAMYAAFLRGTGIPCSSDDLTAFADYQVPRVLRALGILRYAPSLGAKVDSSCLLPSESPEERSIRAATILACEKIAEHVGGTAADVDNRLWQSQALAGDTLFHLTETTWY